MGKEKMQRETQVNIFITTTMFAHFLFVNNARVINNNIVEKGREKGEKIAQTNTFPHPSSLHHTYDRLDCLLLSYLPHLKAFARLLIADKVRCSTKNRDLREAVRTTQC